MKKKTEAGLNENDLLEEPEIKEGKDFMDMEIKWKDAMKEILNRVGINSPHRNYMDTYDKLIRAHKKIFGDQHDSHWVGIGMGDSRAQLDTYLLISIHGMLKRFMEVGSNFEEDLCKNENESLEIDDDNRVGKEDFQEIDISKLPTEFRKQINEKYIIKCFVNSEGIYRVEIKNEPIQRPGIDGTMNYFIDYDPKENHKFNMHG